MRNVNPSKSKMRKIKKWQKDLTSEDGYDPKETVYLLDTNTLHWILAGNDSILGKLKSLAGRRRHKFLLLERIMSELHNMEKAKHRSNEAEFNPTKVKCIRGLLQKYGKVEEKHNPMSSTERKWAKRASESKRYVDDEGN